MTFDCFRFFSKLLRTVIFSTLELKESNEQFNQQWKDLSNPKYHFQIQSSQPIAFMPLNAQFSQLTKFRKVCGSFWMRPSSTYASSFSSSSSTIKYNAAGKEAFLPLPKTEKLQNSLLKIGFLSGENHFIDREDDGSKVCLDNLQWLLKWLSCPKLVWTLLTHCWLSKLQELSEPIYCQTHHHYKHNHGSFWLPDNDMVGLQQICSRNKCALFSCYISKTTTNNYSSNTTCKS